MYSMREFQHFVLFLTLLEEEIPSDNGIKTNAWIFPVSLNFVLKHKEIFQEIMSEKFMWEHWAVISMLIWDEISKAELKKEYPNDYQRIWDIILQTEKNIHIYRNRRHFHDFILASKLYFSQHKNFNEDILFPIHKVTQFSSIGKKEWEDIYNLYIKFLSEYKIKEKTTCTMEKQ